jgi:hypothetical protein
MTERQKMTDEEIMAILTEIWGPPPKKKPKAVTNEGEVVRDADVRVSPSDPNYGKSDDGVVRVRRSDFVTVRMDLYEEQQREKRLDRLRRREMDPARTGIWGPIDDED